MAIDHEEWEKACERIRQDNEKLLDEFDDWLIEAKLSNKTIQKHVGNVKFYINEYLLYDDAREASEGVYSVDGFLGYWFIRKALWASPSAIKENAASLKKFYTFMQKTGRVSEEDLQHLKNTIKYGVPGWIGRLERYDDPDITDWTGDRVL